MIVHPVITWCLRSADQKTDGSKHEVTDFLTVQQKTIQSWKGADASSMSSLAKTCQPCRASLFSQFFMACNYFEPVLECEITSCPSARTQGPGYPSLPPSPPQSPHSQGLHSLQLEGVCCWLRALSDCVGDSGRVPGLLVQAGALPHHTCGCN